MAYRSVVSSQTEPGQQEIKALTALRGIAALAVVLQHYSASAQLLTDQWIPSLAPHGYMAVDFFFVLSGFIMAYTYRDGFSARGWRAYPDFLGRRVARIWPLQVVVVLLIVLADQLGVAVAGVMAVTDRAYGGFDVVANILMLQGFGIGLNLNGPSGTISVEIGAYFLFPIMLGIAWNRRSWVANAGFLLSAALICGEALQEPRLGLGSREVGNLAVRCFTEFTLGLGACRLYRIPRLAWLGTDGFAAAMAAACMASLVLRLDLPAALMFPLLVVAFARNRGWPAALLSRPWPRFLGVVSYSLYLIHSPLRFMAFGWFRHVHPDPIGPLAALALAAVGSVSMIPVAWLAYRWIERPGRDLMRRILQPAPVRVPVSTSA